MTDSGFSKNAQLIAQKRYLKVDENGKPAETIDSMFKRIAKFIIQGETDISDKKETYKIPTKENIDELESKFFEIQHNLEFLSGMVMLDRGKKDLVAACYVMPIHDSLESIYSTLAQTVILHRRGAGIGYDFSEIRPEGSLIKSTGKTATGPISFMRLFDFSSEIIMNRGSVRHAGHMGILRIDHPDIEKFIYAKNEDKIYKKIKAREMLQKIAQSIYESGEPGFIFIDEINRYNPTPKAGKFTSTNQCGEQPLLPYEACNLGSLVLTKFLIKEKIDEKIKPEEKINWDRLKEVIKLGVRFLDNTITISNHLLPEIERMVKFGNRKIGIGVMGWADILYELNIPYDSDEAINLAEKIMSYITENARLESSVLGKQRGNFGCFDGSIWQEKGFKTMRNATVTTIAPTGTTSLFADCNGGIEPFFALGYIRKNMETIDNTDLLYINEILKEKLKKEWLYDKEIMKDIITQGSLQHLKQLPAEIRKVFVTSLDITPIWHIKMQAAFQQYTDNAVSKTINFKESSTVKDIIKSFEMACKLKLKGMSIYRDKSRNLQVLNLNNK